MRTVRKAQEFRRITAGNDETIGVSFDLLLCAHTSLPTSSFPAASRTRLDKLVFFEALEKLANVALHYVGANAELLADVLDDLSLRATALQHFEDLGPHNVEREHVAVIDVEND